MDKPVMLLLVIAVYEHIRTSSLTDAQVVVEEICLSHTFRASCPEHHVIIVREALYGRMRLESHCVQLDMGHIGCHSNVTAIIDRMCSGRANCQMDVPSSELEETRPCLISLKTYLQVSYTCLPVYTPHVATCSHLTHYDVTEDSGFLWSSTTKSTGCGDALSPWQLHAKPGQTINVTLLDFGAAQMYHRGGIGLDGSTVKACKDYGTITDVEHPHAVLICGGHARDNHVIHTSAHALNISLNPPAASEPPFIIYFEVLGCADENPPEGTWYKRKSHDTASMGCQHQQVTWHMKCQGHKWLGKRGNCSLAIVPDSENHQSTGHSDISYGLAIAIILGAALVVCSLIVVIGVIRYRRRDHYDYNATYNTQTMLLRRHPAEEYELRCTCPVPPQASKVPSPAATDAAREQQQRTMTIHRSPHVPRHYSLKKTVEVEGNDYEHIWQTPLPSPRKRGDVLENGTVETQNNNNSVGDNTGTHNDILSDNMRIHNTNDSITSTNCSVTSSFKGDTENKAKKPYYVTSKDILLSDSKERYGTLNSSNQPHLKTRDSNIVADV